MLRDSKNNKIKEKIQLEVNETIESYHESFSSKVFKKHESDDDILMQLFGLDYMKKKENMQYWGRELGLLWEIIITKIAESHLDYKPKPLWDGQSPCDFFIGDLAIDPKYRIGSGDSGTLKGWAKDADMLKERGYKPIILILREDNLPAAISRISGHWDVKVGKESLNFIKNTLNFDLEKYLISLKNNYDIK